MRLIYKFSKIPSYGILLVNKIIVVFILLVVFSLAACNESQVLSEKDKNFYLQQGDSITKISQKVLLEHVSKAVQNYGLEYAVSFCNENANQILDSTSASRTYKIQRLSDKNRNPLNAINTSMDVAAWEKIKLQNSHLIQQDSNGDVFYYKPISIGMPTCLKCHGGSNDITESVKRVIVQKYPDDKAIEYKLGDLRGMWKIAFK